MGTVSTFIALPASPRPTLVEEVGQAGSHGWRAFQTIALPTLPFLKNIDRRVIEVKGKVVKEKTYIANVLVRKVGRARRGNGSQTRAVAGFRLPYLGGLLVGQLAFLCVGE